MLWLKLFERKRITLEVDNQFQTISQYDVSRLPQTLDFYLGELIFAYGSMRSSMFNPTWRNKILDFDYLLEKVSPDQDFKISVNRIRDNLGSEDLKNYSEEFGEAFSLLVAQKLFHTKLENIKRITLTRGRRADYKGMTEFNNSIVFEAKGTTSDVTHNNQFVQGKGQLNQHNANIKALMRTLLNEDVSSKIAIDDPPGGRFKIPRRELMAMEAESLSKIFNFLGHKEFSRYFKLMRDKILNSKNDLVVYEKERLFEKIKANYEAIEFEGKIYKGHVTKDSDKYVFVGIAEDLIYFRDFIESKIVDDFYPSRDGQTILYKGKILFKFLSNKEVSRQKLEFHQNVDLINVSDFHYSSNRVCLSLLEKIFKEIGISKKVESEFDNEWIFFSPKRNEKITVIFHKFYTSKNEDLEKKINLLFDKAIKKYSNKVILVTPNKIPKISKRQRIIDRERLKKCLESREEFLKYF